MNKSIIIKIAALAAAGALSHNVMAADGTINFTGEIVDSACAVKGSSQNMTVALGNVVRASFDGATSGTAVVGKKATPTSFTIDLTGCGAAAKDALVTFTGTADLINTTALRVANAGLVGAVAAQGVAIEIGDSTGTKIDLGSPSSAYKLGLGDNNLNFKASYIATQTTVVAGPASAVAQFTIAYR